MVASFAVIPLGVGEELKEYIAGVLQIVAESGLPYKLGAMQTTIEGERAEVMALIMRCHEYLAARAPRVVTHIALDDRQGAQGRLEGKVRDVEEVLGRSLQHE